MDDSDDKLVIGLGSAYGTTERLKFNSADLNMIVGDATAADVAFVFDGNAQDFHIGLDDTADDLMIGLGSTPGTTPAIGIDENQVVTIYQDAIFSGTTPLLTVGDGGAEDAAVLFDGNAQDFSIGLDDTGDILTVALGTALGTTNRMAFNSADLNITVGDASAADVAFIFDGNAQDFSVGMDDTADKLTVSLGSVLGTTNRMAFNSADLNIVLGDSTAADVGFIFDGNAQDFNISLDDTTDDLVIGLGSTAGTTDAIRIDENQDVTIVQNLLPLQAIGIGAASTFDDSDLTPDVSDNSHWNTNTTGATLTDFDGAGIFAGQVLVVVSKGAIVFDVTTSGIVGGSTDIITAAGDVTTFVYDGADWLVVARIDLSDDLN
jgi:hypothetical protein